MPQRDRNILDEIRLHRLTGDDGPANLDWRHVAEILADELDVLALRLAGAPGTTDADEERVARAAVALGQFRAAVKETDDPI